MVPATFASIGSVTMISWLIAILGAFGLAYVFAILGVKDPQEGGPVGYSMKLSPILGTQTQISYYFANLLGNIATGLTAIAYLQPMFPILKGPEATGIALIVLVWVLAMLNLQSAKWIAAFATVGVIVMSIPILYVAIFGWFHFDHALFIKNWNVTGKSDFSAVTGGLVICVWSFMGIESASVNANLVDNPNRTIPLSTIIGVAITAAIYFFSATVINGMFTMKDLANSSAPYSMAIDAMHGSGLSLAVSWITAIACIASLGSWLMMVSQAGARAAHDGNLPKMFGKLNENGIPVAGVVIEATMITIITLVLMLFKMSIVNLFNVTVSIAALLVLLPYYYSSLYLLKTTRKLGFNLVQFVLSGIGMLFCVVAFAGADYNILAGASVLMLAILIFYVYKPDPTDSAG